MTREERIAKEKQEKGLFYHHEEDPLDFFHGFDMEDFVERGVIWMPEDRLKSFQEGCPVFSGRFVDVTVEQAREWGFC